MQISKRKNKKSTLIKGFTVIEVMLLMDDPIKTMSFMDALILEMTIDFCSCDFFYYYGRLRLFKMGKNHGNNNSNNKNKNIRLRDDDLSSKNQGTNRNTQKF